MKKKKLIQLNRETSSYFVLDAVKKLKTVLVHEIEKIEESQRSLIWGRAVQLLYQDHFTQTIVVSNERLQKLEWEALKKEVGLES